MPKATRGAARARPARPGKRQSPPSRAARDHSLTLLRESVDLAGLPGHEAELTRWFEAKALGLGAHVRHSRLGNCVAHLPGKGRSSGERPRVLLAAHADAIGMVVTDVTADGFLRVAPMGGVDPRLLPGQDVWVHGTRTLPGLFGSIPPHFQTPRDQKERYEFDELFIDVGLSGAEARRAVRVGDLVSFRAPLLELLEGRVAGRAFDNRSSVVILLLAMERLRKWGHVADVYGVTTAQEEVGRTCVGALTSAYGIEPHVALALDVTHGDSPGLEEWNTFKLDAGPVFTVGPNAHPAVVRALVQSADHERVPYQLEPAPTSSGTDAMQLQNAAGAVPTGVIGVPVRSMHSAVETLCLSELDRCARVLARFVAGAHRGFTLEED